MAWVGYADAMVLRAEVRVHCPPQSRCLACERLGYHLESMVIERVTLDDVSLEEDAMPCAPEDDPDRYVSMARCAYDAYRRAMHAAWPDDYTSPHKPWDELAQPERNAWIIALTKAALEKGKGEMAHTPELCPVRAEALKEINVPAGDSIDRACERLANAAPAFMVFNDTRVEASQGEPVETLFRRWARQRAGNGEPVQRSAVDWEGGDTWNVVVSMRQARSADDAVAKLRVWFEAQQDDDEAIRRVARRLLRDGDLSRHVVLEGEAIASVRVTTPEPVRQEMKRGHCPPERRCLACERLGYHLEPGHGVMPISVALDNTAAFMTSLLDALGRETGSFADALDEIRALRQRPEPGYCTRSHVDDALREEWERQYEHRIRELESQLRQRPETAFSVAEVQALRVMAARLAEREGEDVIGVIMKTSGHQFLDDAGVVVLARKLSSLGKPVERKEG